MSGVMAQLTHAIQTGSDDQMEDARLLRKLGEDRHQYEADLYQQHGKVGFVSPEVTSKYMLQRSVLIRASVQLNSALISGPPVNSGSLFAITSNTALALATPSTILHIGTLYPAWIPGPKLHILQDSEHSDSVSAAMLRALQLSCGPSWTPPATGSESNLIEHLAFIGSSEMSWLVRLPLTQLATIFEQHESVHFVELLLCMLSKQLSYLPFDSAIETSRALDALHNCIVLRTLLCDDELREIWVPMESPALVHFCKQLICEGLDRPTSLGCMSMLEGQIRAQSLLAGMGMELPRAGQAFPQLIVPMSGLAPLSESRYLREISIGAHIHKYSELEATFSLISHAIRTFRNTPLAASRRFRVHDERASSILSVLRVGLLAIQEQQKPAAHRQQMLQEQRKHLNGVSIDRTVTVAEIFTQAIPHVRVVQAAYNNSAGVCGIFVMPAVWIIADHIGFAVAMETALRAVHSERPDSRTYEEWIPANLTTQATYVVLKHMCGINNTLMTLEIAAARTSLVATLRKLRLLSASSRLHTCLCLDVLESMSNLVLPPESSPSQKYAIAQVLDEFAGIVCFILMDGLQGCSLSGLGKEILRVVRLPAMGGAQQVMLTLLGGSGDVYVGVEPSVPNRAKQGVAWAELDMSKGACPRVRRCGYLGCSNLDECCETVLPTRLCSKCRSIRFCGPDCQRSARVMGQHMCRADVK